MQYRLGVDAGGTKVAYGLFDEENRLVCRHEHPTPVHADGPAFSDQVIGNIRRILTENSVRPEDVRGVGICMPSFVLFEKGHVCITSAMVNICDFSMRDYIAPRLNLPVILDNDCNVAALAEHRFGAGRGSRHMIYMAVSTGLGSGLILNGQVFRGSYGWAGESGHMLITPDEGLECGCRNRGCFMSWASGRYLPEQIRLLARGRETVMDLDGPLDARQLHAACLQGDALALEVLGQTARYTAVCVFNIYQLLNVSLFVFGGGLTNFGPLLFDRVRAEFDRLNHIPQPVEFRFAQLKNDFGIIGAAELAKETFCAL